MKKVGRGGRREGAGRKPGPERVRIVALVLPQTAADLEQLVARDRSSFGAVIDRLVKGIC